MINENIKKASLTIEDKINKRYLDEFFLRLYSFTNENLKGFMYNFSYQDKKVLTAGSSCDQVLNLISYGCKDISCFDINPFVKYYYELKKAAILYLTKEKYLDFLHGYREKNSILTGKIRVLDPNIYEKLTKYMSKDAVTFWNSLYEKYQPIQIKKQLFMNEEIARSNIIKNNKYLNDEEYQKIRKAFDNVEPIFYHDSIPNLKKINDKYDYVYLTNIFDYIFNLPSKTIDEYDEVMINYISTLDRLKEKLLKESGIMFYHYIWDYSNSDYEVLYNKYLSNFSKNMLFPSNNHINGCYDSMLFTKKGKIKERVLDRD